MNKVAALFLTTTLVGCADSYRDFASEPENNGEYMGWYCEGDPNDRDDWHCQQRLLKDGLPVDKADTVGPQVAETDMAEKNVDSNVESVMYKSDALENTAGVSSAAESETVAMSAVVDAAPPPAKSVKEPAEQDQFNMDAGGYTLQFGAFSQSASAHNAASTLGLDPGQVWIGAVIAGEKQLYALAYGNYASVDSAKVAGEKITSINEKTEFWIRSMMSLRDASVKAQ